MKARILLLVVVLVSLGAGALAFSRGGTDRTTAAEEPWLVRAFDARYEIQADGRVEVTETIKVDFAGLDVDGIYRTLPLEVDYVGQDGRSQRRALKIDVAEATAYTEPVPFTTREAGGNLVLHIERDCTCRTQIEYALMYSIEGALDSIDGVDRFHWNVTGIWPVDILRTDAQVVAPAIRNASCSFSTDESHSCQFRFDSEQKAVFAADRLPFGVGLTINAELPPGAVVVAPPLLIEPKSNWPVPPALLGLAGGIALLLVAGVLLWRDHRAGRPTT